MNKIIVCLVLLCGSTAFAFEKVDLKCTPWEPGVSVSDLSATFQINKLSHDGNDSYGTLILKTPDFLETFSFQAVGYDEDFVSAVPAGGDHTDVVPNGSGTSDQYGNQIGGVMKYYVVQAGSFKYTNSDGEEQVFSFKKNVSVRVSYGSKIYSLKCEL